MKTPIDQMIELWKKEVEFWNTHFESIENLGERLESKDRFVTYNMEKFEKARDNYLAWLKLKNTL